MIHGWPQDHRAWRELVPLLADQYRLILPDLRGFGRSDATATDLRKDSLANDMIDVFDALGLDRLGLVGHDWGGFTGFLLALRRSHSAWMIVGVIFVTKSCDTGAYFTGRAIGRHKMIPWLSPGKTWEGVGGGFILVAALAIAVALWRDLSVAVMLPFCLAVAAISIIGDLTVSMFKRTVGVKDSGTLFPGHGGILDRIDSVAAAAPLFVLGLSTLGLV